MKALWEELYQNHANIGDRWIISLFDDPKRCEDFSVEVDGILLDFSKTNLDRDGLDLLVELANRSQVAEQRKAMFCGDKINTTENRAVLHTALRAHETTPLMIDGENIRTEISDTLQRMRKFSEDVRIGAIRAANGARFTDVVNIGIGGSDLGPAMVTQALSPYQKVVNCHFVSNVDSAHIADVLRKLDPKTTLVLITSKSFTTIETMTNAKTALKWLQYALGHEEAMQHLAAVSTALNKTSAMGIAPERVFGFADWIGGRFSLWGPVGLSIMLAIGADHFQELLDGAQTMDHHFLTAPFARNLPVVMALLGVWHRNMCGYPTRAILPYDQRLSLLPAYLQQLDMESNGKSRDAEGNALSHQTAPVAWGQSGTNGQHSFYQLLHQGTDVIPVEFFIAAVGPEPDLKNHHDLLIANCLAQSEALMTGRSFEEMMVSAAQKGLSGEEQRLYAAHRTLQGNRPSVTIAYRNITPSTLGKIIALYEHRAFVEGVIWGVNSFDQMGIELGKELANTLLPLVHGADAQGKDQSTQRLLNRLIT